MTTTVTLRPTYMTAQPAASVGLVLFVVCLAAGALLGDHLSASQVVVDGSRISSETITTYTSVTSDKGGFNWLIFAIFAAAGMIVLGVCLAAATVTAAAQNIAVIQHAQSVDGSSPSLSR